MRQIAVRFVIFFSATLVMAALFAIPYLSIDPV